MIQLLQRVCISIKCEKIAGKYYRNGLKKSSPFEHTYAYKTFDFAVIEPFFMFFGQNSQNKHYFYA